jgi:hypothetical protein
VRASVVRIRARIEALEILGRARLRESGIARFCPSPAEVRFLAADIGALAEYIANEVDAAPPLSAGQLAQLALLFSPQVGHGDKNLTSFGDT